MIARATKPRRKQAANRAARRALKSRSIESNDFPFELISQIAEKESWRKEIHRPVYHTHKWWAQRLGSVFRAALIGSLTESHEDLLASYASKVRFPNSVVLDPFMGSGTTVGEAVKLGCIAVGQDINPVAFRCVRTALANIDRNALLRAFDSLQEGVGNQLLDAYKAHDSQGRPCDVLYFFWVKVLECPKCCTDVDLFSSMVFARHAYPSKFPIAQILCPHCGAINADRHDATDITCKICSKSFNPQAANVNGSNATCNTCSHTFPAAKTARMQKDPPRHRLYAKLVLTEDGNKEYLPVDREDLDQYSAAALEYDRIAPVLTEHRIEDGFNTRQVLSWGYTRWEQFFNKRQLWALAKLGRAISQLPNSEERYALETLFSGMLEFNNMFCSYKGEGTGAVRHMFAHHVLKPERTPIEANPWGTAKSSGAFSSLFRSRLLKALDYKEQPSELVLNDAHGDDVRTVRGLSESMRPRIHRGYPTEGLATGDALIQCASSTSIGLPDRCVDVVLTDPPFFDNVHYSELADFFYTWQLAMFADDTVSQSTTRQAAEVQDTDPGRFASKLSAVFRECNRVLKDDGLLVFSYHHSREDGWLSVADAVSQAGFRFLQSQPVKAEMSGATPKSQAKEPIDLDVLLVCKKANATNGVRVTAEAALFTATSEAADQIRRFNRYGRKLSKNDVKVVLLSKVLCRAEDVCSVSTVSSAFSEMLPAALVAVEALHAKQVLGDTEGMQRSDGAQKRLFR